MCKFAGNLETMRTKAQKTNINTYYSHAGNKTKPHSKAAAKGAEPDIPVADALNARSNGKCYALPYQS